MEKDAEELFNERISDFSGFELDGVESDEDKEKYIDFLIKKRDKIIEEMKKSE